MTANAAALLVWISTLVALCIGGALALVYSLRSKNAKPATPPAPTSLSFLAGFSFFSGLAAMALVVTTAILSAVLSMEDVLQVGPHSRQGITLAAKIVLYVSLLPSVMAVAFALAARGVISESGGAVRGRPLYRTGVLLAILCGAVVVDAQFGGGSMDWATVGRSVVRRGRIVDEAQINRGYLGVETAAVLDASGGLPVLRVVPGSPADRSEIKTGDVILKVDGRFLYHLPPLGHPGISSYSLSEPYLESYIASLKPGAQVALQLRRGKETLNVVAELSASFESLLRLVQDQSFDHERLAVLKAAGPDRRYSADELLKICQSFDFDDGRLKSIESALPLLQDPQNAFRILGALEFSDAKSKVSGWITERAKKAPKEE